MTDPAAIVVPFTKGLELQRDRARAETAAVREQLRAAERAGGRLANAVMGFFLCESGGCKDRGGACARRCKAFDELADAVRLAPESARRCRR